MSDGIVFHSPVQDEGSVWEEESWTANTGQPVGYEPYLFVDVCQFVDGKHVFAGYYCPHKVDGSEETEFPAGWTVNNN